MRRSYNCVGEESSDNGFLCAGIESTLSSRSSSESRRSSESLMSAKLPYDSMLAFVIFVSRRQSKFPDHRFSAVQRVWHSFALVPFPRAEVMGGCGRRGRARALWTRLNEGKPKNAPAPPPKRDSSWKSKLVEHTHVAFPRTNLEST